MKKSMLFLSLLFFGFFSANGQKIDFSVQAGANVTFMRDFENVIVILNDGIAVSGIISIANSAGPIIISNSVSDARPGFGFTCSFISRYNLNKGWRLNFDLGFESMRFDYDTYISEPNTPNLWLSEYTEDYGNTANWYINLKPLNVSKDLWNDKLNLVLGPTFNVNLSNTYHNILVVYSDEAIAEGKVDGIERVYFDAHAESSLILAGIHTRAAIRIVDHLQAFTSFEYFFNSIYASNSSDSEYTRGTNPAKLNFGLAFNY